MIYFGETHEEKEIIQMQLAVLEVSIRLENKVDLRHVI